MTRHRRTPARAGTGRANLGFVIGLCPTGKRSYVTRAGAKRLVRVLKAEGDKGVRPYWCEDCEHWHAGHLPDDVRTGRRSAAEIYRRRPAT